MIETVVARLKAATTGFNKIGGAADLDAIGKKVVTPGAYVIPMTESGTEGELLGVTEQEIDIGFGVFTVVSNLSDVAGAAAIGGLQARRDAIKSALIGWVPNPAEGHPVYFTSGRLMRWDDGILWWLDEFQVASYWRK
ncbi:phage tail terminator protein [Propionivibrio dicarboxylicus]|uniref:Uncharacterized protein n=1 Tax=Propionivibrio dicarboxylicus TaxID=83767 RepID=A0A1G8LDR9_9RHOO|nr:hypothetical protein [Propionivibrio dicarboxylicus]SDI53795.1 hypothetical protein SAMN05660652_03609 [Propionivibrio dicarboxylicus]